MWIIMKKIKMLIEFKILVFQDDLFIINISIHFWLTLPYHKIIFKNIVMAIIKELWVQFLYIKV